jgi:hypothetical protein
MCVHTGRGWDKVVFIGFGIIKDLPGVVGSGTPCIYDFSRLMFNVCAYGEGMG